LAVNYFGIAAVWAPWKNPKTDEWEKTFATLTSVPNALIEKIHIRQPIVSMRGISRNGYSLRRVRPFIFCGCCLKKT
jgi:hypothetical protein